MKILIVEDSAATQELIGILMSHWGVDFDIASNGQEAVDRARANEGKYDLCLMDIDMPVMNGCEATQVIRRELRYFPIMAVTADLRYKQRCLEFGMDDFLAKPFRPDKLYHKIHELTIKRDTIMFKDDNLHIQQEMPMDQQHAQELRELAKKNLRKVKLFDTPGSIIIVHKNVTNRISHDFNVKKRLVSTFINRDPEKPTRCELYKESNYLMPQTFLTEEEYDDLITVEDQELEKYTELALKCEE